MNNTYKRLLNLVTETGPVKTANKAKKRGWVQSKDDANYNNPSFRAIIGSRKAARYGQRPGAASVAHGREALRGVNLNHQYIRNLEGPDRERLERANRR